MVFQLQRRAEQMKKSLEQQLKELSDKREQFEKERSAWEEMQRSAAPHENHKSDTGSFKMSFPRFK